MQFFKFIFCFFFLFFQNKALHAQLITQTYMGNDTLVCSGKVKNGKRDSVWTYWDSERRVARKMNYTNGKLSDTSYFFHHNGKIFGKENFTTGDYQYFFDNERLMLAGNMKTFTGLSYARYADSSLQAVGKMEGGKRVGEWKTLTKWKELLSEHYENGLKNGKAQKVDSDGNVLWEASFLQGKHDKHFVVYFPSTRQKVIERIESKQDFAHFVMYSMANKKIAELIFHTETSPLLVRIYYANQLPKAEYYLLDNQYNEKFYEQDFAGTYLKEVDNWEESELAEIWVKPRRKYLNYWKEDGTKILTHKKGQIPEFMNVELFETMDFLMPNELPSFSLLPKNEVLSAMQHESYLMLSAASPEEKRLFYDNWQPKKNEMRLRTEYTIRKGYENGWAVSYRKNGQEKSRQYYVNGKPNGLFLCFYKNKRLAAKGKHFLLETAYFSAKIRVGEWTFYHPNGVISAKGKYLKVKNWEEMKERQGKKIGTWYYYDAEGNLLYKEENER